MNYEIVLNNNKDLVSTKRVTIYENDNLADKIRFLLPQKYNDILVQNCTIRFHYRNFNNEDCNFILAQDDERYKDMLSYSVPVTNDVLTKHPRTLAFYLSFSIDDENILFHTNSCSITIESLSSNVIGTTVDPNNEILKEVFKIEKN